MLFLSSIFWATTDFFFAVSESRSLGEEFIIKALYQKLIQRNFTETLILNAIKLLVEKTDCVSFSPNLHIYAALWRFLLLLLIAFRNLVQRSGRSCCNLWTHLWNYILLFLLASAFMSESAQWSLRHVPCQCCYQPPPTEGSWCRIPLELISSWSLCLTLLIQSTRQLWLLETQPTMATSHVPNHKLTAHSCNCLQLSKGPKQSPKEELFSLQVFLSMALNVTSSLQ